MIGSRLRVAIIVALVSAAAAACGGADDMVEIPGIGATRVDVPRPTGPSSAACDGDPLPPAVDATVAERVIALRGIGLFGDRASLDEDALVAEVTAGISDIWGEIETGNTDVLPLLDLIVAEQDQKRVWWRDLEADVADGNDVYAATIEELAAISVGALQVDDIEERWDAPDQAPTIRLTIDGQGLEIRPTWIEDWIDPSILVALNEAIAGSGRRFELYKAFDQTAFVMVLTDAERKALESRGWCFE